MNKQIVGLMALGQHLNKKNTWIRCILEVIKSNKTINPTALRFWEKYFDSYTYSFVRRVDERILR
ncbi:hypothetical protein [Clostridium sp.]|uniref:hypothetical protein n=1 Tax=Clostridium sp. TaxID=1506 RepID=UPI003217799B